MNWYLAYIEKIKNSVEIVTLKEGTILYRFSKEKIDTVCRCNDTGKEGLYFSNNIIILRLHLVLIKIRITKCFR